MHGWYTMQPPVLAAIVTAISAVLVAALTAVLGYWTKRGTDKRLKSLEKQQREDDARLSYEYEARKRVYSELGPLLFTLVEACEEAHERIRGIARSSREGRLVAGNKNRLRPESDYLISTIYRLLAPIAVLRLVQQRLTLVDLSVEPTIQRIYTFAKMLRRSWSDGHDLARLRGLAYAPQSNGSAPLAARQHINLQAVDALADFLLADTGPNKPGEVIRYSTFITKYQAIEVNALKTACRPFEKLLADFHPERRPVLWQLLATQDLICTIIAYCASIGTAGTDGERLHEEALGQVPAQILEWQPASEDGSSDLSPSMVQDCAIGYVQDRLSVSFRVA